MEFVHDAAFRLKRFLLGPQRVRRAQLYGVGIAKSGTHSIAAMFSRNVRARHEPQAAELIDKILDWRGGRLGERELTDWIRNRDRELALEVDSAGLNFQILDILLREFPKARFVLSIRNCYSWTNSIMNNHLQMPSVEHWARWRKFLHEGEITTYAPEEKVLEEKGLYTLDIYFTRWAKRENQVMVKIPRERLFVVRTDQLRQRAFELADFAGLPRYAVRLDRTHEFQNRQKQEIIRQIDRDFLERKVEEHCRPLMTRFFPEIKSLDDAKL